MNAPTDPGANDECATCSHLRWRHREVNGEQVCTEYVDCACRGVFVELSPATRMARVIEAAGELATQFATFRASLQGTMQSLHHLHTAMKVAGLLPEEEEPGLCDGCDTVTQVTATDDGRAQLCASCKRIAANAQTIWAELRSTPALQQLATFHHVDCDGTDRTVGGACGGACTQGRNATQFIPDPTGTWQPDPHALTPDATQLAAALNIPEEAITGPSPDGLPDHWTDAAPPNQLPAPEYSCSTCCPRACDTNRSECRRRPETPTQSGPEQINPTP
jgi:hypothetical protein